MKYRIAFTLLCALFATFVSSNVNHSNAAQKFPSGISGRITDRNGSVVIGAKITIVAQASNVRVSRTSNDEGQYTADLEPDVYDVFAEANGFRRAQRKSIPVEREGRNYVDFVLEMPDDVIRKSGK